MLVCSTDHESPWYTTRGSEECIKVRGRREEDQITLVVDFGTFESSFQLLEGLNPTGAASLGKRYKIRKVAGPVTSPTTVEVFF